MRHRRKKMGTELMTVTDVAKAGDVSSSTVNVWEKTGKLPAIRTEGGMRIFRREDVDRFLEARRERAARGR